MIKGFGGWDDAERIWFVKSTIDGYGILIRLWETFEYIFNFIFVAKSFVTQIYIFGQGLQEYIIYTYKQKEIVCEFKLQIHCSYQTEIYNFIRFGCEPYHGDLFH